MFKTFRNILSVFLALVVLLTTSGFQIYSHGCDCCGTHEISLVEIECCPDTQTIQICDIQHHETNSCCIPVETTGHNCQTSGCCEVQADFFKLNNLFDKSNVLTIKYPVMENYLIQVIDAEVLTEKSITGLLQVAVNSPPTIPVRDFLIFSHSLKIAC